MSWRMTTSPALLEDKYGRPLTGASWSGLPLRANEFPASGIVHDLFGEDDAVLVWTGATTEVTIDGAKSDAVGSAERRHRFTRHSGMIDLLPRGTSMKEIQWSGGVTSCTAIALPRQVTRQLMSGSDDGLDARRGPRYGLIDAHVVDLARRLQEQVDTNFPLGPVYVQGISLALAAYVAARYGACAEPVEPQTGFNDVQRMLLVDYIETHVSLNVGLFDLASLVGYSPDHFTRLFKQSFGTTPHRYVLERRVARAKSMLRERGRSIADIALDCGFSGQTHLNVVFKRLTGSTPGAYRKR